MLKTVVYMKNMRENAEYFTFVSENISNVGREMISV